MSQDSFLGTNLSRILLKILNQEMKNIYLEKHSLHFLSTSRTLMTRNRHTLLLHPSFESYQLFRLLVNTVTLPIGTVESILNL
jgi:hypothetical protein